MNFTSLTAISPIDGRYAEKTAELRPLFSEYGLMRYRVLVEIRWLQTLANCVEITELAPFSLHTINMLNAIVENFGEQDAARIKNIESTTNHDVKAVEYFIREKIAGVPELQNATQFIHFACTSDDINNLAYALILQTAKQQILLPQIDNIIDLLKNMAHQYSEQAMLAHTHGQAATPTTFGKEIANFVARLQKQKNQLLDLICHGKINGAVGNYNAHLVAYPNVDWNKLSHEFVNQLGLVWNEFTTQIEPHDYIAEYCHILTRINTILVDLSRDVWGYISIGYLVQQKIEAEIGSSTMPHKVNPIDFENAEGNLSMANAIATFLAERLPISRWQRDLVDSTLLRNLGVIFGHSVIAFQSLAKGLQKITPNSENIHAELNTAWEVLAEPIQTVMRRYGMQDAYEQLKALTRGKEINAKMLKHFIEQLKIPDEAKKQLLALTPANYLGQATELARKI